MATHRKIDAVKRFNCQSTNCLKLYCVCFASESYCSTACSCKKCFNLLYYEAKVDQAREEAEARNPIAFSTKEVKKKHRKGQGCNCRVRKCLQLFCKCYKAEIGCRSECLCAGCENSFGKRGDNSNNDKMIETSTTRESSDMVPVDQLEVMNQSTPQDYNAGHDDM